MGGWVSISTLPLTVFDLPPVDYLQKYSVIEAIAELRKVDGVKNFKGDGPPTETSVTLMDLNSTMLPSELWEVLWNLSDLQELRFESCGNLEALPEGTSLNYSISARSAGLWRSAFLKKPNPVNSLTPLSCRL